MQWMDGRVTFFSVLLNWLGFMHFYKKIGCALSRLARCCDADVNIANNEWWMTQSLFWFCEGHIKLFVLPLLAKRMQFTTRSATACTYVLVVNDMYCCYQYPLHYAFYVCMYTLWNFAPMVIICYQSSQVIRYKWRIANASCIMKPDESQSTAKFWKVRGSRLMQM